ncbi:MAG: glycine cleavage system protein H, partial [Burkholderiales bacterium]
MASVKNCNLPDDLYYGVENNVWVRKEADGTVTVGMTAYACALAGEVVAYTPKKVGRSVELNKSAATIESGKWVGPVKTPVAGEVAAINDAVSANPKSINADPYGNGWLVRLKPSN